MLELFSAVYGEDKRFCTVSINDVTSGHPLLVLASSVSTLYYPNPRRSSMVEIPANSNTVHLVCPNGTIVLGEVVTNYTTATLICHNNTNFHVHSTDENTTSFDRIRCSAEPSTVERDQMENTKKGTCYQVGYNVNVMEFVAVLTICSDDPKTHWVTSAEIQPSVNQRQKPSPLEPECRKGKAHQKFKVNLKDIWSVAYQRNRLAECLGNNAKEAEKYIPKDREFSLIT